MDKSINLIISLTPSQNEFTGRRWYMKNELRKNYIKEFNDIFLINNLDFKEKLTQKTKKHVKLIRYGKRLLDYGNLVGGAKPVWDAMKKVEILVDDSPYWLKDEYNQFIDRDNPRTEIIIKELV